MSRYVDLDGNTWDGTPIKSKVMEMETNHGYLQAIGVGWLWGDTVPHIDLQEHDKDIYNKAIDDFIKSEDYLMEKIKEEKAEVSIDYEWRKVVCLDDIRRMLHQGLLEIAEQLKGE